MTESIEHYQSIAELPYNKRRSGFCGELHKVDGKEFAVNTSGPSMCIFDHETEELVTDPDTISAVKAKCGENQQIREARDKLSIILAEGDEQLSEILRIHIEYNAGKVDESPLERNGIRFYSVACKGSDLLYYAGIKDGKRYVLLISPGEPIRDENGEPEFFETSEHINEVIDDRWWGLYNF